MQDFKRAFEAISVEPLSPSVGVDTSGVDLSAGLSDVQFSEVRRALGEFGIIFFRDQDVCKRARERGAALLAPVHPTIETAHRCYHGGAQQDAKQWM